MARSYTVTQSGSSRSYVIGAATGVTDYNDLNNLPTLGTAAATDLTDFATAAQGATADAALPRAGGAMTGEISFTAGSTAYFDSSSVALFDGGTASFGNGMLNLRANGVSGKNITLNAIEPTDDQTITFPDATGYVSITNNANGSNDSNQVYAKASAPIISGQAVYISGALGSNKIVNLAIATTDLLSSQTLGLALQDIDTNAFGYIMTDGDLKGLSIDLGVGHGVNEGDPIYLSNVTPGELIFGVANKPLSPAHLVVIGVVLRITGNTLTEIFVKIQNGFELEELHDVAISSPQDQQLISYNSATQLWENTNKDAVVDTDLVLDAIKGVVADPTRIGAEYLPESVEISSMTFADGTTEILPDGAFTGGSNSLLYRHNNEDTGGLPYAPLPRNTQQNVGTYENYRIAGLVINVNCGGSTDFRILTADGVIDITFTSDTTGTLNLTANVSNGDINYEWAKKVAEALNANATFTTHYYASATFGILQCNKKVTGADATLAITLSDNVTSPCGMGANLVGSMSQQAVFLEMARFKIAASENVNGKEFKLFGYFGLIIPAAHASGGEIRVGLAPATARLATNAGKGVYMVPYHTQGGLTADKVNSLVQTNILIKIVTDASPRNKITSTIAYCMESVSEANALVKYGLISALNSPTVFWNCIADTEVDLIFYAQVQIDQASSSGVGYYTDLTLTSV
jgi:hypothetical protein